MFSLMQYAAAAYIEKEYSDGSKGVTLLIAKGRVAPIREITLVKLELLAATVSVGFASYITDSFFRKANTVKFLAHAQVALCWIN